LRGRVNALPERAVLFRCGGDELVGILHPVVDQRPERGVLIIVGGPQYRIGSHRQFVLMARSLAQRGFPVLRFDVRGMGDGGGRFAGFEHLDDDIRAAIDTLLVEVPGLERVVLFGLCDAAAAALMYCNSDARVDGLILSNPWVRTDQSEAATYLRHYYGTRVLQAAFWRKVFSGKLEAVASLKDFTRKVLRSQDASRAAAPPFVERMLNGLQAFTGKVLILLSGRDLTADEFRDLCRGSQAWARELARDSVRVREFADADHTFSTAAALREAIDSCIDWLTESAPHQSSAQVMPAVQRVGEPRTVP
jgi:uncharacterized protein